MTDEERDIVEQMPARAYATISYASDTETSRSPMATAPGSGAGRSACDRSRAACARATDRSVSVRRSPAGCSIAAGE